MYIFIIGILNKKVKIFRIRLYLIYMNILKGGGMGIVVVFCEFFFFVLIIYS